MNQRRIDAERATNLWSSFQRAVDPARGARIVPTPDIQFEEIGGLASPQEEILTYAYAHTRPEVYGRWGTFPPSALLMIGRPGSGKSLLAEAWPSRRRWPSCARRRPAHRARRDPRRGQGRRADPGAWSRTLEELPPTTIFFDELEFTQAHDTGRRAADCRRDRSWISCSS
ncbi:MAG: hypothetical protein R3E53_11880 [Myxococcota bacterium]